MAASPASKFAGEALPPTLTPACQQPPLYDGATRLYMAYVCPYAQRAWIARNCKGLQHKILLVPIDLADRPAWLRKIYPKNQVPCLEHNNKMIGESLDLIKYIDSNFEGPKLSPDDPEKQGLAEELLAYSDTFNQAMMSALTAKGAVTADAEAALDKIETSLSKFDDGPFFLGQFSLVDIAYAPFVDGFQVFFANIKNYDTTAGRPNMQKFIKEMNGIAAYAQTKHDPQELLALTKKLGI
ncbi:protein IN2-1 homolog B-like isoform X1 [Triticum urartu]|uniref:GST N-terminal domain-containing protein n=1 Tax=Triticum urartu TaxID=4572 RepID=A0A8R7U8G9_TRIUA|nr:protein IN2-1 homolog B-like isoform X1 [Triticum urartu]XP_048571475.1 protein IN2-1 homolog B-like isoform X1 [Triticum urartu]